VTLVVDHLVYAVADLDAGVDEIEQLLGVRAADGGKHTGRGTHNALISLGGGAYLEIIGPDREQPDPPVGRPFGIDSLKSNRLVTWAARTRELDAVMERARVQGYDPGPVMAMSRALPDGRELHWRLAVHYPLPSDGLVPFLIEWGAEDHPASTAPGGCRLVDLEGEHPHPEGVVSQLEALGAELQVSEGGRPALLATIECPKGTVVLS
jgi:hypothetical protein